MVPIATCNSSPSRKKFRIKGKKRGYRKGEKGVHSNGESRRRPGNHSAQDEPDEGLVSERVREQGDAGGAPDHPGGPDAQQEVEEPSALVELATGDVAAEDLAVGVAPEGQEGEERSPSEQNARVDGIAQNSDEDERIDDRREDAEVSVLVELVDLSAQ